ncbi:MAG TPA: ABC transporter substrate-binding protein [Hyphomicrobiaceae bacterium]|nr:ABC transporter substrate-binding protein [Hyphomicrobiaceae bacterium]
MRARGIVIAVSSLPRGWIALAHAIAIIIVAAASASAEVGQLRISRGFGVHYLPLYVMQEKKLLQKRALAAGLDSVEVEYLLIDGGNHINDAVLARSVDIASTGTGGFLTLWAKSKGNPNLEVIGLGGSASGGMTMTTRNPTLKSLRDVTEKDRIAVPGIKTSLGAIILQMAVAKEFGDPQYARLDHLTVSLPYPEAVAAMLSGRSEITAHIASAPFSYMELESPGIHKVFNSVELFGHLTTIMAFTTQQFRSENPKLTASFVAALQDAIEFIAAGKVEAAQIYAETAKVKQPEAEILRIINDPDLRFTLVPAGIMSYANFMHRVGLLKLKPESWKDVFVSELHGLPGN